ncbi:hypothetical protein AVEN_224672-1 [Araneus ventricosus]|uniref:Uncharacterized protein n=1 Tax=Araneus ventricosus TaxID=182803 RepID=A0A4Y2LPH3_ARAVE|nr:hypothetical protein AVEN_224672-1 [Araneus ventricosus]
MRSRSGREENGALGASEIVGQKQRFSKTGGPKLAEISVGNKGVTKFPKIQKVSKNSSKSTRKHRRIHPERRAREIHNGTGNQTRSTTINQISNGKQFNRCQATAEVNTKS